MEWTKIPTDLLQSRIPDKEIVAIVKYQLLWAMLERQPEDEVALRYMTPKQLAQVRYYTSSIEVCVANDIKTVTKNRERQKIFYKKKQDLIEKPNGHTNGHTNGQTNGQTTSLDKIRLDKSILEKEKEIKKLIKKLVLKENQFLVDENFRIKSIPEYEIYQKEVGEEILQTVQEWLMEKKYGQVVDKNFICKQIVNFSKRNGLI